MNNGYSESYLDAALNPKTAPKLHKALIAYIRNMGIKFDTIVCRGTSGLLVAPIVAQKMKKELIVVRKSDGNHSSKTVEGHTEAKHFIIIDDFVCTGITVKTMLDQVSDKQPNAKCVAVFGWRSSGTRGFHWTHPITQEVAMIPKFSMWPNNNCDSFIYEPPLKVRELPAKTPVMDAESFFDKPTPQPPATTSTPAVPDFNQTIVMAVM